MQNKWRIREDQVLEEGFPEKPTADGKMQQKEVLIWLRRVVWIVLFFIIVALIFTMVEKKKQSRTIDVVVHIQPLPDGNDLITKGDVFAILDKSFGYSMEGLPQNAVNVERMERVLKEDPFILDAEVYLGADNSVQIEIDQRIPILRVIDKMELSYYLDKEGNQLPLSRHFTARVLTATGNIPPHIPAFTDRKDHPLNQLFDLSKKVLTDEFFRPLIEQIYINNKREYILIPKIGEQRILFGKFEAIDEKLGNLRIFYQKAILNEGWRKYKTIDLRYKDQVIAEKV